MVPVMPWYFGFYLRGIRSLGYVIEALFQVSYWNPWNPWKVSTEAPSAVSSNPFYNGVILSGAKRSRKISPNAAETLDLKRFFGRLTAPSE
jgi:hypothetical protein